MSLSLDELYINFDESINLDGIVGKLLTKKNASDVDRLRQLYNEIYNYTLFESNEIRIPKKIHQIWIGSKLPKKYSALSQTWQEMHPLWDYKLWTDKEVEEFDFSTKDLFENSDCIGQKGDLLRAEIVNKYGGLYVDIDYECFKPFDIFNFFFDFYTTIRTTPGLYMLNKGVSRSPISVCTSIFGSIPGHPILKEYLKLSRAKIEQFDEKSISFSSKFIARPTDMQLKAARAILTTYHSFHDAFLSHTRTGICDRVIAMPPAFFHPLDTQWKKYEPLVYLYFGKSYNSLIRSGMKPYLHDKVTDIAFAAHYSTASWL